MPFLVVLGILVIVAIGIVVANETRSAREEKWRSAAEKLHGTFRPGGFFDRPEIVLPLKGQPATLTFLEGKVSRTKLEVLLPPPSAGSLKIEPDSMGHSVLRLFGMRDVEIGDRLFDEQYYIVSEPESIARTVFAPERRAASMTAVRRLNHCHGFSLEIEGRTLRVEVMELLEDPDVIVAMARTAEEFLGFVSPVLSSDGIQMDDCADGQCPICAAPLAGESVQRCGRCRAPAHRECWEYVGRCTTFGCEPRRRSA